jgi:hypothetical protein
MSTGPFSQTISYSEWKESNPDTGAGSFCRTYYRPSTWYRSGNRHRHAAHPLPYTMNLGVVDFTAGRNQTCNASGTMSYTALSSSVFNNLNNLVLNRAISKFVADAQGVASANLGETLGEWRQSLDTITRRLKQLATAALQLRRGNFTSAARTLGCARIIDQHGHHTRKRLKNFGDQWLELHLGWEPLMSDIYNANEAFLRDPFPTQATGRAGSSDFSTTSSSFPTSKSDKRLNYRVGYRVSGYVKVSNPNVALAAQLGLINPVSVAWQLVPFSFVVDWFVNLGELLSAYDGLLGCITLDPYYTTLRRSSSVETSETRVSTGSPWVLNTQVNSRGVRVVRTPGMPPVHLTYPTSPRFSWQRGLTACALLLKYL